MYSCGCLIGLGLGLNILVLFPSLNVTIGYSKINQSINHAAGDAPYVSLKKRIAGVDTVHDYGSRMKVCRNTF